MNLKYFIPFLYLSLVNAFKPTQSSSFHTNHIHHIHQETGKEIVLQVSSLLPKLDTVGHDILRANHDYIQNVLANDILSHEAKKTLYYFLSNSHNMAMIWVLTYYNNITIL